MLLSLCSLSLLLADQRPSQSKKGTQDNGHGSCLETGLGAYSSRTSSIVDEFGCRHILNGQTV